MSSDSAPFVSSPMVSEMKNIAAESMEVEGPTSADKLTAKHDIDNEKVSKVNGVDEVSANGLADNQDVEMEVDSVTNINEKANMNSSNSSEKTKEIELSAQSYNDKIDDEQAGSLNEDQNKNGISSNKGDDEHSIDLNIGKLEDNRKQSEKYSSETNKLLDTVKDENGGDILITLNEDNNAEKQANVSGTDVETNESKKKSVSNADNSSKASSVAGSLPAPPPLTPAPGVRVTASGMTVRLPGSSNMVVHPVSSMPMLVSSSGLGTGLPQQVGATVNGAPVVQQGSQLGYITKIGNQTLFVPLSAAVNIKNTTLQNSSAIMSQLSQVAKQSGQVVSSQPGKAQAVINQGFPQPKSSWEMMEMMRWEVANRIADNWNWSIAFHQKKEELSSVTNFLLELGSDVVKEQVYKDIIQIQTKKKENGDLKDQEVESLEKMKTVYENTRKKVEHLELGKVNCEKCDFQSESNLVLENHFDFPHFEPEWDVNKGWMVCTHCKYRTKVIAQFVFHMNDMHKRQAKFMERDPPFQCPLCPMNASTKNKLEKHQTKCTKHFKLNMNLQPYYHDVNFCMKSVYYKPKKPVVRPPPPPPAQPKVVPKPSPTMNTRQQGMVPMAVPVARQLVPVARPQQRPAITIPSPPPLQNHAANIIRPTFAGPTMTRPMLSQNLAMRLSAPQQAPRPPRPEMAGFEVCELCGGYVKDRQALRIHFYYAHKVELPLAVFLKENAPLSCQVCKLNFWTTQGLAKHKTTSRHFAPTGATEINIATNQCFMCLRKVSNIFTHVEQTHGMTMKDLVLMKKCIMCGATSTDRQALEKHIASIHGIVIKTSDYVPDKAPNAPNAPPTVVPVLPQKTPSPSVPQTAKNIGKINYCVFCEIQFPDNIQLTVHCLKKHATCKTCGMVVQNASFLTNHDANCMKANKKCSICGLRNMTPDSYAMHLKRHIKPSHVKILNMSEDQIDDAKEKLKREYKPAVISLDSEDSDVEVVDTDEPDGKGKDTKEGESAEKAESADQNDTKDLNDSKEEVTNTTKEAKDDDNQESGREEINSNTYKISNIEIDNEDRKEVKEIVGSQSQNGQNTKDNNTIDISKSTTGDTEKFNEDLTDISDEKFPKGKAESSSATAVKNDANTDAVVNDNNEDFIDENIGTDMKSQGSVQKEIDEDLLLGTEEGQMLMKRKMSEDGSSSDIGAESKKLKLDDGSSSTDGFVDNSKMDTE
ncbi:uncharacterized protein LOC127843623 [Dreissena polymorpha]|uniref:C2H2-type domain-containing protein n=1 Tax=Dreissena polymorpha TaxID=45954 RepID=A0A9D4EF78_DREPO|nr:uncharacterized protein LOC127843623 [Dreissena polymorpha]XP_052229274.1 uncharacterized protein LOC127843623 [Dreissena polymorpha]XP_052229275.1 uncharacterized protein LOC127843623 [Dreissena polymorpha]KAH3778568.1 hypothetical protein DPMN_180035 [Dreissena polymorpha]